MNIFVLDTDPRKAAQYLCDKHVVKMTLEYAQILSVYNQHKDGVYRPTHLKHPCVLWAGKSIANYQWLWDHAKSTACELSPQGILMGGLTPFVLAMPEYCKKVDPIESYRAYCINEKLRFAKWSVREQPDWIGDSHGKGAS